jgi:hypothetical protein
MVHRLLSCYLGLLKIYRVLGSVAFLNSGNILHPILAKSQCWCVDGESKFVLRIRPHSYYRIELPYRTSEDSAKVAELKDVLAKVLQYEVTACPFKRGFTVDLPEPPLTPIQKRPWKPKPRLRTTPESVTDEMGNFGFGMKGLELDPDSGTQFTRGNPFVASSTASSSGNTDTENDSEDTDDTGTSPREQEHSHEEPLDFKTPTRPKALRTGRAITAPPQLILKTVLPPNTITTTTPLPELRRQPSSLSSSVDSFHSFHSPISPLAPSPPSLDLVSPTMEHATEIDIPRTRNHKRDVSEITVTADFSELSDLTSGRSSDEATYHSPPDMPGTPILMSDATSLDEDHWSEAVTPSPTQEIRRRTARSRRRTQSPLPSSVNLYSPYSPRSRISGHHLTTAILQRTCSLLLGPPVQLVALMLRIAAKITKGTFRGSSFGFGEGGQKIPCSWDFSDGSDDNWEEDDYGFSLSKASSKDMRAKEMGGSWEID